ncbi:hypothetical protein M2132_001893 [Dysgonomonas sp. PH5-45]|nr:hypothetical protein [Dysgonomonas sp. PH5-45]MDH6388445.1 hypothetical protein [Dysgonomonas sp. PH5-37]
MTVNTYKNLLADILWLEGFSFLNGELMRLSSP